jgi:hypothetical protein
MIGVLLKHNVAVLSSINFNLVPLLDDEGRSFFFFLGHDGVSCKT